MKRQKSELDLQRRQSSMNRFVLVFTFVLANYGGRFNSHIVEAPGSLQRLTLVLSFVFVATMVSAITLTISLALEKKFFRLSRRYFFSALVIFVSLVPAVFFFYLYEPLNIAFFGFGYDSQTPTMLYFFSALVLCSFIFAAIFRYEQKILERLAFATRTAITLDNRQKQLVEAEEQQKGQTSRFLHDRVQAELVVISMQLATVEKQTAGTTFDGLDAIRARLERLRRVDLRLVSNALQPNIKDLGLKSAVDDLLEQLSSGISFVLQIDDSRFRANTQMALGIYRIIEQALVNSITHGPASCVKIKVGSQSETTCFVTIEDDGPGASSAEMESGFGTVLIDSWVSILKATKDVTTKPGEGYKLTVTIPL